MARRFAATDLPVLLLGETGTGKELFAREVHRGSPRAQGPFVPVNCGAMVSTLTTSTLFGHERGAFTGADRQQRGVFEQANGGTLFLDEVGELSPEAQAALLRVLESQTLTRVGGVQPSKLDVRVVAATNRELWSMIGHGRFRRDLYYRLTAFTLALPPLRKRSAEIAPLAHHFLGQANRRFDCRVTAIEPAALEALLAHSWPGNVRELRNVIERAVVLSEGDELRCENLPPELLQGSPLLPSDEAPPQPPIPNAPDQTNPASFRSRMRAYEASVLIEGLRAAGGHQGRAALLLDMPLRTLCRKMKQLGISRDCALN